jgi:YD repeat-containing protein
MKRLDIAKSAAQVSRHVALIAASCLIGLGALAATVEYTYDANGRLKGVYAPSGDAAQYVYDPAGNMTQILRFASTSLSIVEFTPTSGPVGTQVLIYGTGFSATPANNAVTFNGVAATVSAATANKLTATVPSGATTGPIGVVAGTNSAASSASFTVTSGTSANTPTISSFTPSVGAPGTAVTISGTNFDSTAARNEVSFNAAAAVATTASPTSIGTSVPSIAGSGAITVRTINGTAKSSTDFLVPFGTIAATDIVGSSRAVVDGATASYSIATNGKVTYVLFDGVQGQHLGVGLTTNGCILYYVERPDSTDLITSGSSCGL